MHLAEKRGGKLAILRHKKNINKDQHSLMIQRTTGQINHHSVSCIIYRVSLKVHSMCIICNNHNFYLTSRFYN